MLIGRAFLFSPRFLVVAFLAVVYIMNGAASPVSASSSSLSSEAWREVEGMSASNIQAFEQRDEAPPDAVLQLVFNIKQKNMDKIESILLQVSDPTSANYGKHLTRGEIDDLTRNTEGHAAVAAYLAQFPAVEIESTSSNLTRITAKAPVHAWNAALNTHFHVFVDREDGTRVIRTSRYALPESVSQHVESVFNTVQLPVKMTRSGPIRVPASAVPLP
jgi:subtilase family serine protease